MTGMKTQTYAGDRRDFDPDTFIGTGGRFFRPVSAIYSREAGRTVISYEPVPMSEMPTRYGHLVDQAEDKLAIAAIFGGKP